MKFLKEVRKYLSKNDIVTSLPPLILPSILLAFFVFMFFGTFLSFITSFFVSFFIFVYIYASSLLSEVKTSTEKTYHYINLLMDLIDLDKAFIGSDEISVRIQTNASEITTYSFHYKNIEDSFVSVLFDRKNNTIKHFLINSIYLRNHDKHFQAFKEKISQYMKSIEEEAKVKLDKLPINDKDDSSNKESNPLLVSINTLSFKSESLLKGNSFLSFEDNHFVKETVPHELKRIKEIYESFSEKGKDTYKKDIESTLLEIEKGLSLISDKADKEKANELLKSHTLIQERVKKRLV